MEAKVVQIGNSLGIILPKDALSSPSSLNLQGGALIRYFQLVRQRAGVP